MKMRKWLACLLAVVMGMAMLPGMAFASDAADGYVEWDGTGDFPTSGKVRLVGTKSSLTIGSENGKNVDVNITGDLTIDLNGKALYIGNMPYRTSLKVQNGASLTVEDSAGGGKIVGANGKKKRNESIEKGYSIYVNGGDVTIKGGYWKDTLSLMYIESGNVTISGGQIETSNGGGSGANGYMFYLKDGQLAVTGGEIANGSSNVDASIYATGGTVNITGGKITTRASGPCSLNIRGDTSLLVSGGKIECSASVSNCRAIYIGSDKNNVISGNAEIVNSATWGTAIEGHGSLEVRDNVQIRNTGSGGTAVDLGGPLTLSGGQIVNESTSTDKDSYAITLRNNDARVNMTGGTVQQNHPTLAAFYRMDFGQEDAQVSISGGLVTTASQTVFGGKTTAWQADVTGGTFNKPVTDYVAEGRTAISYTSQATTLYAVGNDAQTAANSATQGDTITVLKGDQITVPDQVIVENSSGAPITVNGTPVAKDQTIEAHNAAKVEAKDATCTEAGNKEYWHCTDCGKYFSDAACTTEITEAQTKISATGHNATKKVEAKPATETEVGNKEYWHCTDCGKYFSDAACTTEITEEQTKIPAKGHSAAKVEAKPATETKDGNIEYWYCAGCGKYFSDAALTKEISKENTVIPAIGETRPEYRIIEGANGSWTQYMDATLTFRANGGFDKFTGVKVDGKWIDSANYTAKSGSTIVTLKALYLKTLAAGEHKLTVAYNDGECSTNFTVKPAPNTAEMPPKTGDSSHIALWLALMALSALGLGAVLLYGRKSKASL